MNNHHFSSVLGQSSACRPADLLTAQDEILWYQELEQYADALGDEGDVRGEARIRAGQRSSGAQNALSGREHQNGLL